MEEETWKTNNMSLAAFLTTELEVVDVKWEMSSGRKSCFWYFKDSQQLADLVADFMGGIAVVDPKEYNDTIAEMKKEMFALKGS